MLPIRLFLFHRWYRFKNSYWQSFFRFFLFAEQFLLREDQRFVPFQKNNSFIVENNITNYSNTLHWSS